MAEENEYLVQFDFSTFKNSCITGRHGSISIKSELSLDQIKEIEEEIKPLCVSEVGRLKPKWQIFSLDIKSITHAKKKKSSGD